MRAKFQDVECYRDYQYEYNDYENTATHKEFTVWKPPSWDDIIKEEEKPQSAKEIPGETDLYTELLADELGLRSLKNQSGSSAVEQLDLSFLNYDAIDVPDGDINTALSFTKTKSKRETSIPKPNALNETLFPKWKEGDGLNVMAVNLLNQNISKNTTQMKNTNTPSTFYDSYVYNSKSTTLSIKKDNTTKNSSVSVVVANLHDLAESTEITNLTRTLQGSSSSIFNTERMNVTLTDSNQTSKDTIFAEDSEKGLTRGDAFIYSVPHSNTSTNNLQSTLEDKVPSLSHSTKAYENNTVTNNFSLTPDGTKNLLSIPTADVDKDCISSVYRYILAIFGLEVESKDNKNSHNDSLITAAEPDYKVQINSSETVTIPANSNIENVTHISLKTGPLQNVTDSILKLSSSRNISSEGRQNVTAFLAELNPTSSVENVLTETVALSNVSLSSAAVRKSGSEELNASDSSEEVFIYLKENSKDLIKTTSVKMQGHNWTYEGTHQTVPMEIPDYIMKYLGIETPQTKPDPKKKTVNLRKRPQKGQGMKTRKRKEYKPQARTGLPFSPRGFNPGMTPRGSRPQLPQPISDEDELINKPVVIGVPRPDFSDYELYVPGGEPGHLGLDKHNVKADEYEYVMYKDPYSSHEDINTLNLDETTKYYLKYSGTNVRTYFIAAEEVEWDYSGYGQR